MNRRNFLTLAAASGLGLVLPPLRKARGDGGTSTYGGPYWITVQADGGWDPTYVCDPKGGMTGDKTSVNQLYTPDQIGTVGAFSYAPISMSLPTDSMSMVEVYSAKRFFQDHDSRLVALNGVDTSTNNHEVGRRVMWSGLTTDGAPSIGALAAAQAFGSVAVPMAFLTYGGYDTTGNVVPLTRASNVNSLWSVAYPNRITPNKDTSATYHTAATEDRIAQAQAERLQRLMGRAMPVGQRALRSLLTVRQTESSLESISQYLPANLVTIADIPDLQPISAGQRGNLSALQGLMQQAQLALGAFQAGAGVAASLVLGGFDTHSNHDSQHVPRLVQLLRGVDYIFTQAQALGLADKLYVLIASDFGRTPYYNAGNGKDHWAVTSMIVSGPGITGGRVIGSTDPSFKPMTVDPMTLQPSSTGVRIQPQHIHHALRQLGGFDTGALAAEFPLPGSALPFFS